VFVSSFVSNSVPTRHCQHARCFRLAAEQLFHLLRRIAVAAFEEVAVGVHRQLDRRVAEPLRDLLRMHTLIDEKRRVGVTKIVESQLRQAVRLADHLEAAQDVPLLERRSGMGRKHQTVLLPRLAGKLPQLSHGLNLQSEKVGNKARKIDCPAAPLRFRRPELEARNILALLPPRLGDHLVYGETSDRQVQIRQAEPVQFFRPQARRKRQRVERFVPITGYGCEEGSRLLGIQESDLCSAGLDCTLAFSNPEPRPSRIPIDSSSHSRAN